MVLARVGLGPSWLVVKIVVKTAGRMTVNWLETIVGGMAGN